jgi:hypothetical protein
MVEKTETPPTAMDAKKWQKFKVMLPPVGASWVKNNFYYCLIATRNEYVFPFAVTDLEIREVSTGEMKSYSTEEFLEWVKDKVRTDK